MTMTDLEPTDRGVPATAQWTAAVRALENRRADALFRDPWAAELAGREGEAWIAARSPESVVPIVLRTRYFDDCLQRVVQDDGIRQVVLLAAGLDTRAYRLPWPEGSVVYELDHAQVLWRKEELLHAAGALPGCRRSSIGVDLAADWESPLAEAGFDREKPSAWLVEGLLFYLPSQLGADLLDRAARMAAPGSWLGFDIVNEAVLTSPITRPWIEMQAAAGAPWIGAMDDPESFLAERGWTAELSAAGQPEANHGRWSFPVIPVRMPGMPHNWFVVARKTAAG
jgi:methyltransferase (TIGR00027 family)